MKEMTCKCGKVVAYKTNKPKRCDACRDKHDQNFQYKHRKPQRSKKEAVLQKVLNEVLPEAAYIDNGYYSYLMSPKGSPLQLDRFYPDLKLAFEFNGRQHYEFNPYMHKDKGAFEYLQECDRKKRRDCKRLGITLITVKYNKTITAKYILKRLEEAGVISDIKKKTKVVRRK